MTLLPDGGPLLVALRQGLIEASDAAVALAILQAFEWKAGRCWAEWPDLAASTGMPEEAVRAAAERLMQARLLAVGRDADRPSWWFWVLHPHLVSDGRTTPKADRLRWAQWAELVAAGARPDDRVSCSRLRYLKALARKRELKLAAAGELAAAAPVESACIADLQTAEALSQAVAEGAQVLTAALAPAAPAAPARGRRRPAGGGGPVARVQPEGEPGVRPAAVLPGQARVQPAARVVSIKPSDAHRAADLEWRRQSEERRRQRQQQAS